MKASSLHIDIRIGFVFIAFLFLLTDCQQQTPKKKVYSEKDSIYTVSYITKVHWDNPSYAMKLIAQAEEKGMMPSWRADSLRMHVCYDNFYDQNGSLAYGLAALSHDSIAKDPQRHVNVLGNVIRAANLLGRYSESIKYCSDGVVLANKIGDEYHVSQFNFTMGKNLYLMNERPHGLQLMFDATNELEKKEDARSYRLLVYCYSQIINAVWTKDISISINTCLKKVDLLKRLEIMQEKDSNFIGIMYGQAFADLAALYAEQGDIKLAKQYEQKYKRTGFSKTVRGKQYFLNYYHSMHLPDELLATVRQCDSYWLHRDTICGRYAHVLGYTSDALLWKDDLKGALEYRIRQIKVKDSIDDRENREETKRMAALYQAYEKEMALEKEKARSARYLILSVVVIVMLLLSGLFAFYWYRQHKILMVKDRKLLRMLDAITNYQRPQKSTNSNTESCDEDHMKTPTRVIQQKDMMKEKFLNLMDNERVFLQPDFGRDRLQEMLGVSKNALTPLLRELIGENTSISDYVNDRRIAYACQLMKAQPTMSIEAVSSASGFTTTRNFRRCLNERFGMSPTQFRKASLSKEEPSSCTE